MTFHSFMLFKYEVLLIINTVAASDPGIHPT
jgi:hypothetical protein